MQKTKESLPEGQASRKVANGSCALLLAGLVSMTLVAVSERNGDLDQFRAWVSQDQASSQTFLADHREAH